MDGFMSDTIMFVVVTLLCGWVLYLLFRRYQLTTQAKFQRIEAYNKLLDKFASAKEFADFLETEQGKKMLEDPMPNGTNAKRTALRFIQVGGLLAALGAGLFMNLARLRNFIQSQTNPDINFIHKEEDFFYWTWIVLAMAGGCLLVGFLTYTLGKKWNLSSDNSSKR